MGIVAVGWWPLVVSMRCVLGWSALCFVLADAFRGDGVDVEGLYTEEQAFYFDNWVTTMKRICPFMAIIPFSVL